MKLKSTILLLFLLSLQSVYAQYIRKTDLPAIYIETFDGRNIYSKQEYKYCKLYYVDEIDNVISYDSVSIRGRGNSTWNMAKKPYKLKFNNKEKFLGKGYAKAKKWTLLANAGDKTMMRNAVTSAMGAFTSLKFNPAAKFVDLILNNEYIGTYQISDQVEVKAHRVNIEEQPYPITDTTNITGGYLLEVDGFRDGNCFNTSTFYTPVRIHYPEDDEIDSRQTQYIRNYINNTFEKALSSTNFTDSLTGYRAYVDTTSLIDWYLCTEVSANIDGFYSTYFYKEKDNPRLFWGPLWDYDIAYNNDYRIKNEKNLESSVNSLMVDIAYNGSRSWIIKMWKDPWFQNKVNERYQELLSLGLVDYLQSKVDSITSLLQQSQELNYEKWGINKRMYHEIVLYSSYDRYVTDLKNFITQHCDYLLQAFADKQTQKPVVAFEPQNYYYHITNAKTQKAVSIDGENIIQLTNDLGSELQDWIIKKIGSRYQIINRHTNKALNDPTIGDVGPETNVGTQLNVADVNDQDERQLWEIIPQGSAGYYNLLNIHTQHIANLYAGNADENTPIVSYTNDSKNSTSTNRLWFITPNGSIPEEVDGINDIKEPEDYALAYNPQTKELHFGCSSPEELTFTVRVYAANGQLVGTFLAKDTFSMLSQRNGVYMVMWSVDGQTRSVKFTR